jgi:hypothetical protein
MKFTHAEWRMPTGARDSAGAGIALEHDHALDAGPAG